MNGKNKGVLENDVMVFVSMDSEAGYHNNVIINASV